MQWLWTTLLAGTWSLLYTPGRFTNVSIGVIINKLPCICTLAHRTLLGKGLNSGKHVNGNNADEDVVVAILGWESICI